MWIGNCIAGWEGGAAETVVDFFYDFQTKGAAHSLFVYVDLCIV